MQNLPPKSPTKIGATSLSNPPLGDSETMRMPLKNAAIPIIIVAVTINPDTAFSQPKDKTKFN